MINYDSDDSRRSPGLEPIAFRYTPAPSPDRPHPNPKDSPPDRKKLKKKHHPSQGDVVLLNVLAPNLPEIAHAAGERALISDDDNTTDSQSVMSNDHANPADVNARSIKPDPPATARQGAPQASYPPHPVPISASMTAAAAPPQHQYSPHTHLANLAVGRSPPDRHMHVPAASQSQQRGQGMTLPPVRTLLDAADEQAPQSARSHHHRNSLSSATSPGGNFGQSPPQGYYSSQQPQSYGGPSPAGSAASEYAFSRMPIGHGQYQQYEERSQAGSSSQGRSPWPPASSTASAASHPTPGSASDPYYRSTTTTPQDYTDGGDSSKHTTLSPPLPGVNTIQGYRCQYAGCTAPPFQTQYLLNSHANVHSQNRPHFCPVADCPRSEGGKGFKRKNEMIRHGLVHSSPGYVCPYCPDREHKYPRPDNLQRHVKMHHGDKPKDDPLLRDVLAQRLEGSNSSSRGRRRRGT
ncbi:hypothetical protein FH972_023825 [Carpinus fangiana]|uniref:C2H2-type domain-containing protein n=1 Tax=Carpinus fangiana TaxID=176857 RepID=A0A5N6KWN7_9ROSI|nr:hypothetical protein FH972_023825 [Carpinus fangiana]